MPGSHQKWVPQACLTAGMFRGQVFSPGHKPIRISGDEGRAVLDPLSVPSISTPSDAPMAACMPDSRIAMTSPDDTAIMASPDILDEPDHLFAERGSRRSGRSDGYLPLKPTMLAISRVSRGT